MSRNMDASTTLTTFMLQTPPTIRSVRLIGSWDNFAREYPMEKDINMGSGHWRGCHTFQNITCDGERSRKSTSREGGLKMGGRYWYFYQLDGEIEYHDPTEPFTSACPYLPGQPVNILDVPIELGSDGGRSRSVSASIIFTAGPAAVRTMDPAQKFVSPRPAPMPSPARLNTSPSSVQRVRSESRSPTASTSSWIPRTGATSPSSNGSGPTLSRFLPSFRKGSTSEPAGAVTASPRGCLGHIGREQAAHRKSAMEIGSPSLIDCTNLDLQCISLSTIAPAHSNSSSRAMSRETSPLRKYIFERPRELSPLERNRVDHRETEDACGIQFSVQRSARSRESSRLRHSLSIEDESEFQNAMPCSKEEEDDYDDEFDFGPENNHDATLARPLGLTPAPSRSGSVVSALLLPRDLSAASSSEPLARSPSVADVDIDALPNQSHFSVWSATTTSSISTSLADDVFSFYPGSPSLSTSTASSSFSCGFSVDFGASDRGLAIANGPQATVIGEEVPSHRRVSISCHQRSNSSKRNATYFGADFAGIQGYSLPTEEHDSMSTLTKRSEVGASTTVHGELKLSLPEAQRLSSMEDFFHDLGYLGDLIAPN